MPPKLAPKGPGSGAWWEDQIAWATEVREQQKPQWLANLSRYRDDQAVPTDSIVVNIDYEKINQKTAQLFFRVPRVILKARRPGMDEMIHLRQQVINDRARARDVGLLPAMREMIFDALCTSGLMGCLVGYEAVEQGKKLTRGPDVPAPPQPGAVLQLQDTGMQPGPLILEPIIVDERYFVRRLDPSRLLIPPDFVGSDYNTAWGLGHNFWMDRTVASRKKWPLPDGDSPETDNDRLTPLLQGGRRISGRIKVTEWWYWASRVDSDSVHPGLVRRIVFLDGVKNPVIHENSRYQRFGGAEFYDEQNPKAEFTTGIRGLPLKVKALRFAGDTPYPPSDSSMTRHQVEELSEGRSDMRKQRKRSIPMRGVDKSMFGDDADGTLQRILDGEFQDIIPIDGDPAKALAEIARAQYPRENMLFDATTKQDIDRSWALGQNQGGVREDSIRTATELSLIQRATDTRMSAEQDVVVDHFVSIVEALDGLMMLYHTTTDYVRVVGPSGEALEQWSKQTLAGPVTYEVIPHSAQRPDADAERVRALEAHNQLVKSPNINSEAMTRKTVLGMGGDPTELVVPTPPPPVEKPSVSMTFKGEDLDPRARQYANVIKVLAAGGVGVTLDEPQNQTVSEPGQEPETVEPSDQVDPGLALVNSQDRRAGGFEG